MPKLARWEGWYVFKLSRWEGGERVRTCPRKKGGTCLNFTDREEKYVFLIRLIFKVFNVFNFLIFYHLLILSFLIYFNF